jgi:echinoid protein
MLLVPPSTKKTLISRLTYSLSPLAARHIHENLGWTVGHPINMIIEHEPHDDLCSVEQSPEEGRYDLHISHSDYDRDNGKFECRIKEDGTGVELYTQMVALTVLLPPGPPTITKSSGEAVEGQEYSLACSSQGGSPAPSITWLRAGDGRPLEAVTTPAGDRDGETVSVLGIVPSKEEDGSEYLCEVASRALPPMAVLSKAVNISVNCEFPPHHRSFYSPPTAIVTSMGTFTIQSTCSHAR